MRRQSRHLLVMTILSLTLVCSAAYGQSGKTVNTSFWNAPWTFDLAPMYLWLPAMEGDVTVLGQTASIDLGVGDTVELIFDSLKFAFTTRFEAHKGDVVFFFDITYLNLEDDGRSLPTGAGLEISSQFLNLEFGTGYRLVEWPLSAGAQQTLALEALAGGRYVYMKNGIEITGGPIGANIDVEADVDWIDPFIGARIKLVLSKKLTMAVRGDVGGFGIGSDLTWSLVAGFLYHLSQHASLGAGYRVLDIDYAEGSGVRRFEFDTQMRGPQLGFMLHF